MTLEWSSFVAKKTRIPAEVRSDLVFSLLQEYHGNIGLIFFLLLSGLRERTGGGSGEGGLNAADWRPGCTENHEQRRVGQLPAGPHPGVPSSAGLRPQQDGEDRGAGREQRREDRYGIISFIIIIPPPKKTFTPLIIFKSIWAGRRFFHTGAQTVMAQHDNNHTLMSSWSLLLWGGLCV